jgi:hypothetical protein
VTLDQAVVRGIFHFPFVICHLPLEEIRSKWGFSSMANDKLQMKNEK